MTNKSLTVVCLKQTRIIISLTMEFFGPLLFCNLIRVTFQVKECNVITQLQVEVRQPEALLDVTMSN